MGDHNRIYLQSYGVPEEKTLDGPLPFDLKRFVETIMSSHSEVGRMRQANRIQSGAVVFGFAEKYIPRKRPLDFIEALAHGRPAICTNVPSMTHLVRDEVNGLVSPMGDASALAERIRQLADSPRLVTRFAQQTRNVPSVTEYVQRLSSIHEHVLANGQPEVCSRTSVPAE